jgi:hypothetical protein
MASNDDIGGGGAEEGEAEATARQRERVETLGSRENPQGFLDLKDGEA